MSRIRTAVALCGIAVLLAVAGCSGTPIANTAETGSAPPNIVFVLTDDLSMNLLPYMPHVQQMQREGMSFSNYSVTDSLCCPSRSSIFTGKFPHDTGVFTNSAPDGGYPVFRQRGNENRTFATALQDKGYRTAMMGKYMNEYPVPKKASGEAPPVPPGWDEWDVAGNGYPEFGYTMNENGKLVHYGKKPKDYLTDVVSRKANSFAKSAAQDGQPFMLETATFAPHGPYTPAPRDKDKFPGLRAPRGPAFDQLPADAPPWLANREPLPQQRIQKIDKDFRKRAQSVQAVDAMIGRLQDTLRATGQDKNTYFVFSSDNGFHMGEYRLASGKQTAFDTDVRVPLVVTGPGVPAGRGNPATASNIDLAPTFESLGGATPAPDADGRSLVPLLHGQNPPGQPDTALVEHHGPDTDPKDPDYPAKGSGNPPSYAAMRTAAFTYTEYDNGAKEYYDRRRDPGQLHNTYDALPAETRDRLHRQLTALRQCHGTQSCTAAARTG
ncbi:sulfatase family protein [Sciscionella sediminilitoris]|uniref:sulfatase family protein n=1 Tax=Sciscionella sediminilitoris TaxID=1445613 RepID=UPI0004DF14FB|nr:sulfatase [Sciscionella sp. SE31]